MPPALQDLISKGLEKNPAKRITLTVMMVMINLIFKKKFGFWKESPLGYW